MAASKKRAKLAADLLGAGAATGAAGDLSKLAIVKRDRRAEAERLRVIENEELRNAEARGAPAAETLFYKKGAATAVTFRPHYWTYERHSEPEGPSEFTFESKGSAARPSAPALRPVEAPEPEPEARPTQAQMIAALNAGSDAAPPAARMTAAEPPAAGASSAPAASQAAEVMVLPANWGALSPEKVAALLAERPPEGVANAPVEAVAAPEPLPELQPLPPKPTSEKIRKALLLLWPEHGAPAAPPVVTLPAAEAPPSDADAVPAETETALAAEPAPSESVAPPAELPQPVVEAEPPVAVVAEPPASVVAEPPAETAAPAPEEPPAEILAAAEPALTDEPAVTEEPSEPGASAPTAPPSEPPQAQSFALPTVEGAPPAIDEPVPESAAEPPAPMAAASVPWFVSDERSSAEPQPAFEPEPELPVAAAAPAAPTEPWPLADESLADESPADEIEERAEAEAEPRAQDSAAVTDELGVAIESVLAQRWYGAGKSPADWKSTMSGLPTVAPVSESSLIAELAQARGEDGAAPDDAPAPPKARSLGDRVLGFICVAMVLALGYFGYAIWGDQILSAAGDLLR